MPPELMWAIGTASVFIVGILGAITGHRTLQASKRRDAHEQDDRLLNHYRGSWEAEVAARRREREDREQLERKVDEYREEQEATRAEVSSLRAKVEKLEGLLGRMASFVRHVLDRWAEAMPGVPVPTPWPDIAHLIREARSEDLAPETPPAAGPAPKEEP